MEGGLKSRAVPRGQFRTVVFEDVVGFKTTSLVLGPKIFPKNRPNIPSILGSERVDVLI